MAERSRGMGRGLAAILSAVPTDAEPELRELPIDLIEPNPNQPRRTFTEEPLVALAESLKTRGVLQPVLVRPAPGWHVRADRWGAALARRAAGRARTASRPWSGRTTTRSRWSSR